MRALSSRNSKSGGQGKSRSSRNVSGVRYDVLDRVGEGTLFVVYRVRDKNQGRILALKALKNNFNAHGGFASALAQAATDSAAFSHPSLARIEEVGREDGTVFLLQEWLPGQSLEARLRRAPFGRIEALTSTRQIAEALQILHEKGAVHGDLRPRQVISSGDGNLKLTDYGLSQAFGAAGLSSVDVLHDAVGYMAPELGAASGNQSAPATPASDLYALGVVLYRMLAGRPPFDGSSLVAIAMRHRNDSPLPPSRFNPQCPPDLEELALRLLQKNPQDRPASAAQVLHALNGASNSTSNSAATLSPSAAEPDNAPIVALTTSAPNVDGAKTEPLPSPSTESQVAALSNTDAKTQPLPPPLTPSLTPFLESEADALLKADAKTQPLPPHSTPSDTQFYAANMETTALSTTSDTAQTATSSTRMSPPDAATSTQNGSSVNASLVASSAAGAIAGVAAVPAAIAAAAAPVFAAATAMPATVSAATPAITATSAPATSAPATSAQANTPLVQSVQSVNAPSTNTPSAAGVVAGTGSVSSPPSLPPTDEDLAADKEIERKARRKHRRREALGAFLAFFWVWVAVGLLGGMVYGSYRWWVNSTPRDVKVPTYVGQNEAQAKQLLRKSGLNYAVLGEVYDPRRPAGTILRGFPAPGKTVKLGRVVSVTVSRGAEKVVMPDLSELTLEQVRQVLQRAGMRLGNISTMYNDTIARGYICGQYPAPGDSFSRSESINLIVSRGAQPAAAPTAQLPPPPELPDAQPPTLGNSQSNAADQGDNATGGAPDTQTTNPPSSGDAASDTPQVSRTVLIRIPVPLKAGASSRDVRVVVRDAGGEHTVYEQSHAPGELVDEYVQITRAQGGSATILIYIDGVLQKQQRV
jgi:serine/threonine protein kinase/beta-lactam-binding protein with PASTA domain